MSDEKKEQEKQTSLPIWAQDAHPRPLLATPGCNKREYFAGLAMMGLMDWDCQPDPNLVAIEALKYADALLAALDQHG